MNNSMELGQYMRLGLKWWWLIILGLIIGAVVGYFFNQQQPIIYQATTTLIVGQPGSGTGLNTADLRTSAQLARTYASMSQRQPILQGVVDNLGLEQNWKTLRGQIVVVPVPDTQLLEITGIAASPEEAKALANEVANQLILLNSTSEAEQQNTESRQFVEQRLENLRGKIEAGQERLSTLEEAMSGSLSAQEIQKLQAEINNLESLITDWENNFTQLFIFFENEKAPNNLAVFEPAEANAQSVASSPIRNALTAAIMGLMAALGLIFLIEYLDDTIKAPDDINQLLNLILLGKIYQIKGKSNIDKLISDQKPFSLISEAYRIVRSNLQFMSIDRPNKSILITSPSPGEGKSITTANLGVVMAQAGFRTVIVDTDLRRPIQHQLFQVDNSIGLTDLLRTPQSQVEPFLKQTNIENLQLINSGSIPPNPSELLGSQRMEHLVETLSNIADVIIYDSPPVLAVADALVLANQVDGVVLVVQAHKTRIKFAKQAIATLQQAGANLLGGVANRITNDPTQYYYYQAEYSTNGHGASKQLLRTKS